MMAQCFADDPGLVPSTYKAAHTYGTPDLDDVTLSSDSVGTAYMWCTYMQAQH